MHKMSPENPEAATTVDHAKKLIWSKRWSGAACPCCGQMCRVYKRTITDKAAAWLVRLVKLWRQRGGDWVHVGEPDLAKLQRGGDYAKMVHWGLIEAMPSNVGAKKASGFWRPTEKGVAVADGNLNMPRYAHIYLNKCIGFSGGDVSIFIMLGHKFDYAELTQ